MTTDTSPIPSPFEVVIDDREKLAFTFANVMGDAIDGHRPIFVRTSRRRLESGDYAIGGLIGQMAIERKSHVDLYGSLGGGRKNFELELSRLNEMEFAAVVIESSWEMLAYHPPIESRMNPKCVMRSIFAYCQRFPRVHWFPMGSRAMAEVTAYRLMDRFVLDKIRSKSAEAVA